MNVSFGQPTPEQGRFLESSARLRAFLGDRGAGKTWAGAVAAWRIAVQHPGAQIAVCRAEFGPLMETAWPALRQFLPPGGGTEALGPGKAVLRLKNGSGFIGVSMGRPELLLGRQFDAAWLDEPDELPGPAAWEALLGRLHGRVGPHRAWATGRAAQDGWIAPYFLWKRAPDQEVFTAATRSNPHLLIGPAAKLPFDSGEPAENAPKEPQDDA